MSISIDVPKRTLFYDLKKHFPNLKIFQIGIKKKHLQNKK